MPDPQAIPHLSAPRRRQQLTRREWERRRRMYRRRRIVAVIAAAMLLLGVGAGVTRALTSDEPVSTAALDAALLAPPPAASAAATTSKPAGPATSSPAAKATPATDSLPVVLRGNGTFTTVVGPLPDSAGASRVVTYVMKVENGLGADKAFFARAAQQTLLDDRGWQPALKVRFVQLRPADLAAGRTPDVTIVLASPPTVDRLCAPLKTEGKVSCANLRTAVLNYARWQGGVSHYGNDLDGYQHYMVNHEVGHLLGFSHVGCGTAGQKAPVMMQQTIGLDGCAPNPWPSGARG